MEGKIDIQHTNDNGVLVELRITNGQNKKITLISYHIRFCLNYIEIGNITGFEFQCKELDPHKSEKILTEKFFIYPFILDMIEDGKEEIGGVHSGGTDIELLYIFDEDMKVTIHREKINLDNYKLLLPQWNNISSKMTRIIGIKQEQIKKISAFIDTVAKNGEDIKLLKEDMIGIKKDLDNIKEKFGIGMKYISRSQTRYERFKKWLNSNKKKFVILCIISFMILLLKAIISNINNVGWQNNIWLYVEVTLFVGLITGLILKFILKLI